MKITDLTVTVFAWKNLPSISYTPHNPLTASSGEIGLVTVRTDQGVDGHAFLGSSYRSVYLDVTALVRHLKPLLLGRDPLERERLFHDIYRMRRAATLRAIGAVDMALWDICGKVANLPIHRLVGGCRTRIPAYATSSTFKAASEYVQQALELKQKGYRGYKILPPGDFSEVEKTCRAVRDAVGPDTVLMIDPAGTYDFPHALRLGRLLEELDFYWYEDPLRETDIYNYVKLRQKLDIPIMATEYAPGGFDAYAPWLMAQATDYLRADVAIKGGLTPVFKAAHLAEAFGMNMEIHHGGNSLNNVANLHATMAIQNIEFFEILMPAASQQYGLIDDIAIDADGYVNAFNGPGLGAKIDFELIKKNQIEILS